MYESCSSGRECRREGHPGPIQVLVVTYLGGLEGRGFSGSRSFIMAIIGDLALALTESHHPSRLHDFVLCTYSTGNDVLPSIWFPSIITGTGPLIPSRMMIGPGLPGSTYCNPYLAAVQGKAERTTEGPMLSFVIVLLTVLTYVHRYRKDGRLTVHGSIALEGSIAFVT